MFLKRICFAAATACALLAPAGCQQHSTTASTEMKGVPGRALVVSGGNSSSGITVFVPSADGGDPVAYCSAGTEVCPECRAAAVKYFQTGVLDPKCSRTGAIRTALPTATPNVGHN